MYHLVTWSDWSIALNFLKWHQLKLKHKLWYIYFIVKIIYWKSQRIYIKILLQILFLFIIIKYYYEDYLESGSPIPPWTLFRREWQRWTSKQLTTTFLITNTQAIKILNLIHILSNKGKKWVNETEVIINYIFSNNRN